MTIEHKLMIEMRLIWWVHFDRSRVTPHVKLQRSAKIDALSL